MKDFNLHFGGHFDDLGVIVEAAKAFVEELEKLGVEFDHSHFASGALLGGARHNVNDIDQDNPAKFSDGTSHPPEVSAEPVV